MNAFMRMSLRVLQYFIAFPHVLYESVSSNTLEFGYSVRQPRCDLSSNPCHSGNYVSQASSFCGRILVGTASLLADVNRTDLLDVVFRRDRDAVVFVLNNFLSTESERSFITFTDRKRV